MKHSKNRDACISGCSHTQINPYQDTGEYSICEEIWMFPGYQLYWNWSNLQTGTFVCRLWVNGPRSIGAPRALHDHTTVNSKLQWGELKKKKWGTSLAVQWLRFCTSSIGVWIQSLVRKLRSHMLHGHRHPKRKRQLREILILAIPRIQSSKL